MAQGNPRFQRELTPAFPISVFEKLLWFALNEALIPQSKHWLA